MIRGLFETFVFVSDFERSRRFYEDLLGLNVGWLSEDRRTILYWVGPPGHFDARDCGTNARKSVTASLLF